MAFAHTEPKEMGHQSSAADRIAGAIRDVAHLSQEARRVTSMAREVGVEKFEDLKGDATHYVKHQPLTAVAVAAGIGLAVGVVVGWIGGTLGQRRARG